MIFTIFDTETTSLDKPFCYNVGYIIINILTGEILKRADYVVEQVWHNPMLFTTAYYANKRADYVKSMRCRQTKMDKFGYICQQMIRDFKAYGVTAAFAYNSPFDEKVFNFNCDWFKCNNPFDNIPIYDIRGYAHHFICNTDEYKNWYEEYERFSDSGNYSTTAENVYQYVSGKYDFIEDHTALSDSIIESEILVATINNGAEPMRDYKPFKTIKREHTKNFTVKFNDEIILTKKVSSIRYMKTNSTIILKG